MKTKTLALKIGREHLSIPLKAVGKDNLFLLGLLLGHKVPENQEMKFSAVASIEQELPEDQWFTIIMSKDTAKILKTALADIELW